MTMAGSCTTRRALTLVEMMLALSITAMIGLALTAMLTAISTGMETRHDARTHLLHANAAQIRLSAYIAPSLCVLYANGADLVLWHNDSRRSGTVHASELRWLLFDEDEGTISVYMVDFPDTWTQTQRLVADAEFPVSTDWIAVYRQYQINGWVRGIVLVDGLDTAAVALNEAAALDARQVTYRFVAEEGGAQSLVSASLRTHREPN